MPILIVIQIAGKFNSLAPYRRNRVRQLNNALVAAPHYSQKRKKKQLVGNFEEVEDHYTKPSTGNHSESKGISRIFQESTTVSISGNVSV